MELTINYIEHILLTKYSSSDTNIPKCIYKYLLLIERGNLINILEEYNEYEKKTYKIPRYINLNDEYFYIMLSIKNHRCWEYISEKRGLSELFIEIYQNHVWWNLISTYQILSESFIKKFQHKVNWKNISGHQILSEPFIHEFINKIDWSEITCYQKLSDEFIEEFKDKIDWFVLCDWNEYKMFSRGYRILTEDFIRKYKDYIHWESISRYHKMSEDFLEEFTDRIDWYYYNQYQMLTCEVDSDELNSDNYYFDEEKDIYILKDEIIDNIIK